LKEKASAAARYETANQPFPKNEEFDKYLQEIIVPLFDSNNNKITGEVVLSFTINNNGRPENIKVVKSSCAACEKLAVALLENGPDWIVEKQKWETVLIKF
jgi:hypothetical protein